MFDCISCIKCIKCKTDRLVTWISISGFPRFPSWQGSGYSQRNCGFQSGGIDADKVLETAVKLNKEPSNDKSKMLMMIINSFKWFHQLRQSANITNQHKDSKAAIKEHNSRDKQPILFSLGRYENRLQVQYHIVYDKIYWTMDNPFSVWLCPASFCVIKISSLIIG